MGIMTCESHYYVGWRWICPHILFSIENGLKVIPYATATYPILKGKAGEFNLSYCPDCAKNFNFPPMDSEISLETFSQNNKKFKGVCVLCFDDWIQTAYADHAESKLN